MKPALVPLWHPEKNGDLSPSTVDAAHAGLVLVALREGHDFQRAPLLMVRDASCPTCALAETSLAATHPAVASRVAPGEERRAEAESGGP